MLAPVVEELFSANAIKDDLLRMMFSCCHPRLGEAAQVPLILYILCGFSVGEIASAFGSTHAAIEQRITRAKKVLAGSNRLFETTAPADFSARLPAIHRALYLLFNEGYHGASAEAAVLPNCAEKPCGLPHCFWSTRSERRPRHTRSPPGCVSMWRACPHASTHRVA